MVILASALSSPAESWCNFRANLYCAIREVLLSSKHVYSVIYLHILITLHLRLDVFQYPRV